MSQLILYSFRRCPYAIRCRMVLEYTCLPHRLIEVSLRNKPAELLRLSQKSKVTVPVLHGVGMQESFLLEESWEIMQWALERDNGCHDKASWWIGRAEDDRRQIEELRRQNDTAFKFALDRYKYPSRFTDDLQEQRELKDKSFETCCTILRPHELTLQKSRYLLGSEPSLADIAIMSFVRQCANVDYECFSVNFPSLLNWLQCWENSALFMSIMSKDYAGYLA